MATSIDYSSTPYRVIVQQSDLTAISGSLYELDTDILRLDLKALEAAEIGIVYNDTHKHNTEVTLGGVTLARTVEILNTTNSTQNHEYELFFSPDTLYSVRLKGSNNNLFDIQNGILANTITQIIPNNSAGLINLDVLLASAYQGHVVHSFTRGQAGQSEPVGTFKLPSDNEVDLLAIAVDQGVHKVFFTENISLDENWSDGYTFEGSSPSVVVTANAGANMSGSSWLNITVQGELDSMNKIQQCFVLDVTALSGVCELSSFGGDCVLSGDTQLINCLSGITGDGKPSFDIGAHDLQVSKWSKSIEIKGAVTGSTSSIELQGGRLFIDATCTGGTINVRGTPFEIVDNSGVGCTVNDQTESQKVNLQYKHMGLDSTNPVTRTPTSTSFDDVTIEHTGDCETSVTSTRL